MASIIYNGVECELSGKFSQTHHTRQYIFDGQIQLEGSDLKTQISTLEDKLRRRDKDFKLKFDGSIELEYSHSDDSGFLMYPTLTKLPNELSTGKTREYRFKLEVELPVDQPDYNYIRSAEFRVDYSDTRQKNIHFQCEYTAGDGSDVVENYLALFIDYVNTILAKFGGSYFKIYERISPEYKLKIGKMFVGYKEGIFDILDEGLTSEVIVESNLSYNVDYSQESGSAYTHNKEAMVPARLSVNGDFTLNRDSLDVNVDFAGVYVTYIRPYIYGNLSDVFTSNIIGKDTTNYYTTRENISFSVHEYKIHIDIEVLAPTNTAYAHVIDVKEEISIRTSYEYSIVGLWDGIPNTFSVYSPGARSDVLRVYTIAQLNIAPAFPPEVPHHIIDPTLDLLKLWSHHNRKKGRLGSGINPYFSREIHHLSYSDAYLLVDNT